MGFEMKIYENGLAGLAAICDTCGEQITEHGYVVWNETGGSIIEWRVIHKGRCDSRRFEMRMALRDEHGTRRRAPAPRRQRRSGGNP